MLYSSIIGRSEMPFQIFIGGRGIGKTYSAISDIAENGCQESPYIYLRRTAAEIEKISSDGGNIFKAYNRNSGKYIITERSKDSGLIYDKSVEDEPRFISYALALSTFAKMRGVDYSDVDVTVFDEFIPEKHVHRIANEGEAFLHFYESVNRNREFDGRKPMRVYMLANSISLNNDILLTLGVVSIIADMKVKGRKRFTDRKRGIYIELMENAEFSERKSETALYRLAGGTDFSEQALNNKFTGDDMSQIRNDVNLNEYKPILSYGNYTVYQHKSNSTLYICKKRASGIVTLREMDRDIMYWRFAPRYRMATLCREVFFDDYTTKIVFDQLTTRA